MKELTFNQTGKSPLKVSKITIQQRFLTFTPNAIFLTHWLEKQFHDFSVNTILTAIAKKTFLKSAKQGCGLI